jgi:hypothetical protein
MGKNIKKVNEMLDGTFGGYKIQVGVGDQESTPDRKVGDKWTDSDGVEWEQKEGYYSKVSKMANIGIFHKQCKDCKKNCSREKRHSDTFNRFNRCWYCQVDFEYKLKSFPGKWEAWVRLQQLNNMDSVERDMIQMLEENEKLDNKKTFDMSVANSLANWEVEQTVERNKKLTS